MACHRLNHIGINLQFSESKRRRNINRQRNFEALEQTIIGYLARIGIGSKPTCLTIARRGATG